MGKQVAKFRRQDNATSQGDAAFSIEGGSAYRDGDNGKCIVLQDDEGREVRLVVRHWRVYMDADEVGKSENEVTISFDGATVKTVDVESSEGSAAAAESGGGDGVVLKALVATGDEEAVALQLAAMRGSTRTSKSDRRRAKALIDAAS